MKVKDLISKLQLLNPDALVVHRGYEDGYDPAKEHGPLELIMFPRKDGSWYNGTYEYMATLPEEWDEFDHKRYDATKPTLVVLI